MFKIEKKVKMPTVAKSVAYPFADMNVGDSFFVTNKEKELIIRVRSAASQYARRNNVKFVTRTVEGGLRIWRVK